MRPPLLDPAVQIVIPIEDDEDARVIRRWERTQIALLCAVVALLYGALVMWGMAAGVGR